MKAGKLPSDGDVLRLKQELNFLLWPDDPPEVPEGLQMFAPGTQLEAVRVNIQCVAHTTLAAGFFIRKGLQVTSRVGMAVVIENGHDGSEKDNRMETIAKHWWMTLDGHGLVDLSLHAESEDPLIYCNQSVGGRWNVEFADNPQKLNRFVHEAQQGCFYMTQNKRRVTEAEVSSELAKGIPPAKKSGIHLSYAAVLEHCEKLLTGDRETLIALTQREAWERLSDQGPGKLAT